MRIKQKYYLHPDISRCSGQGLPECKTCLRQLAPSSSTWQSYIAGNVVDGECLDQIDSGEEKEEENNPYPEDYWAYQELIRDGLA